MERAHLLSKNVLSWTLLVPWSDFVQGANLIQATDHLVHYMVPVILNFVATRDVTLPVKNTTMYLYVGPLTHKFYHSRGLFGSFQCEDCDAFGDRSNQRNATSESLGVDAPGSSHVSSHSEELKILSVYGKGEGPLATNGHDTLFTASEVEALNSLSADHSVAKSLERGERLVCREELSVQQTPDTISIKVEEDIGGGLPAAEDCDAFGDRSTQRGATSEILGVHAPGSSHVSSHSKELKILGVYGKGEGPLAEDGHDTLFTASEVEALNSLSADHSAAKSLERGERLVCREELSVQQTPDTISIKVEEDIGRGMPAVEDGNDIRDCSTQRGATSESLRVDAPGSSHMSSHSGELRILSVYGQGEGPLAVDVHNTLFAASEPEALSSLSADHSAAKSLNCSVRLVRLEELTGVLCGKVIPNNANMIYKMRTHSSEKPYRVVSVAVLPRGVIKGSVQASQKKKVYEVEVHVEGQTVKYSSCQCPIGRDKCHHMAAVLIWVEKNVSRTDVECAWKRAKTPSTDQIAAKRVSEMTPSTTQAGIKRPVTQEDKDWVQATLSQLGRLTGIGWILSPETPRTLPIKTFEGLVTNPDYAEAEDKALHLLSSFVVTNREKQQIERATVGQAKNALWSAYRQKRITASNFGLVLAAVKRKSYPPSLFKTLLGQYNLKQGSKVSFR
ncbi:unnamed protein product [Arctogadus glacialis]